MSGQSTHWWPINDYFVLLNGYKVCNFICFSLYFSTVQRRTFKFHCRLLVLELLPLSIYELRKTMNIGNLKWQSTKLKSQRQNRMHLHKAAFILLIIIMTFSTPSFCEFSQTQVFVAKLNSSPKCLLHTEWAIKRTQNEPVWCEIRLEYFSSS